MKNKLLSLVAIALLTLIACKESATAEQSESVDKTESPDYASFDKKAAVMRSFIKAHIEEDLNAQAAILSDTLKWSPPYYNDNKWLGKEDYLAVLKGYHENFENNKFIEGITLPDTTANVMYAGSVFPKETASNAPNAIRIYGTWRAKHTESGKDIGVKWFAIGSINEAGEIVMLTEYFDVNGLAVQIAEE